MQRCAIYLKYPCINRQNFISMVYFSSDFLFDRGDKLHHAVIALRPEDNEIDQRANQHHRYQRDDIAQIHGIDGEARAQHHRRRDEHLGEVLVQYLDGNKSSADDEHCRGHRCLGDSGGEGRAILMEARNKKDIEHEVQRGAGGRGDDNQLLLSLRI